MHFLIVHITYVFMGQASRNKFALLKKTKIFWLVPYNAVIKNAIIVEKKNPLGFVCKTENIDFHFLIFWNTLPKPAFCVNSLYISMQICRKGQSHPCLFLNGKKSMPPSADRGQRNIPSWKKPAPRLPSCTISASALILPWKPTSWSRPAPSGTNRSDKEKDGQATLLVRPKCSPIKWTLLISNIKTNLLFRP